MTEKTPSLSSVLNSAKAESSIKCCVVDFTLEVAETVLKHFNNTNRPLSGSQTKLYANELLRGKWALNGEPIIFGVDDKGEHLISGQHRLKALVLANKLYNENPDKYPDAILVLHTVAITGVQLETADTVDLGMTRKHADVLFRDEWVSTVIPAEWNSNASRRKRWVMCLAGAARLVWLRAGGATVSSAIKFQVSEMLDFIKSDHRELCDFVSAILSANEEEGGGLRMSLPYIAALTYVASMNDDGTVHQETKTQLLDAMLHIAQGTGYAVGSAEHALSAYWNTLNSQPGSKDRDLDTVGPFIKAVKCIINGEKTTAAKLKLTKKEAETYKTHPPLFEGWDTACFINAAETKAGLLSEIEEQRARKEEEKAKAAEAKAAAKAEAEAAKAAKAAEAKEEAAKAKANAPSTENVMQKFNKMIKRKPQAV